MSGLTKRHKPLVLFLAPHALDDAARVALRSWERNVGTEADLVVPEDASPPVLEAVAAAGGSPHRFRGEAFPPHLWAAQYLNRVVGRRTPDRPVLVVEGGHVVFQTPDFFGCCVPETISLLVEPWPVAGDTRAREQFESLDDTLRRPLGYADRLDDLRIVSTAVTAGPAKLVANWQLARAAADARTGPGDASATVNLLAEWVQSWPWVTLVPATDPWAALGHWAGVLNFPVRDGRAVCLRTGEPYPLFVDWHRVPLARRPIERAYL